MSNIKLLPCPCCKGEGRLMQAYQRHFPLYAVICQCGLQTKDTSVEKAVEIWNKRQPIDDIVAELDKKVLDSADAAAEAQLGMCGNAASGYRGERDAYEEAIKIVKRGGINDK